MASGTYQGCDAYNDFRDLLARAGRSVEAAVAFREAAALTRNDDERTLLSARADDQLTTEGPP